MTRKMLRPFVIVLLMIGLTGCASWTMPGGATEQALCETWGNSLPSRSRQDTTQTATEIQRAYADFLNACPGWAGLVPGAAPE